MAGIITYLLQRAEDELNTLAMLGTANGESAFRELHATGDRLAELGFVYLAESLRGINETAPQGSPILGQIATARQAIHYARVRLAPDLQELAGEDQLYPLLDRAAMPAYIEVLLLARLVLSGSLPPGSQKDLPWLALVRGIWQGQGRYQAGPWLPGGYFWPEATAAVGPQAWTDLNYHPLLRQVRPVSTLNGRQAFRLPNAFCVGAYNLAADNTGEQLTMATLEAAGGRAVILPLFTTIDPGEADRGDLASYGAADDGVLLPALASALDKDWGVYGYQHLADLPLALHDTKRMPKMVSRVALWPLNSVTRQNLEAIMSMEQRLLLVSIYRSGRNRNDHWPLALLAQPGRSFTLPSFITGFLKAKPGTGDRLAEAAANLLQKGLLTFLPLTERLLSASELQRAILVPDEKAGS